MTTMVTKQRFDLTDLVMGRNVKETPQGFLEIEAYTARTGIQRYMVGSETIDEYRPAEEVFSEGSIASLKTAPLTDGHPKEFVGPGNAKELIVGFPNGTVERKKDGDEEFLVTKVIVTHQKGIDAIKKGKVQLSNGYNVDLEFVPGVYNGKKYDATQRNIVNNHIALVYRGRAGAKASLRLDEGQGILLENDENINNNVKGETMKLTIDGKEYEVNDEAGKAIKSELAKSEKAKNDAETKVKELETKAAKVDELETEKEVLKTQKTNLIAKVDSLESDLEKNKTPKMDADQIKEEVKKRISLVDTASKMLTEEEVKKIDEMDNEEIKKAVIKADSPKVDEEKLKDANYVNARFDHICENMENSEAAKKVIGKKVVDTREENKDGKDKKYMSPEEVRKARMDEDRKNSEK